MKITISKVQAKDAERKAAPAGTATIKIKGKSIKAAPQVQLVEEEYSPPESKEHNPQTGDYLTELHMELGNIKRQRGKLSSQTAYLVIGIEAKLKQESEATAEEFMKGNVPMPELAEHYAKIEALTQQATAVWDKIRYVETYGDMPSQEPTHTNVDNSEEVKAINANIRRYNDYIHKTRKKLQAITSGIKQKTRAAEWTAEYKERIAMAEVNRDDERKKLKRLQYESRNR